MIEGVVDHLFRHQYGKMVSILTKVFGISNLELIEDAVQDTFVIAIQKWRKGVPENPEAWLTMAAKNRAIDILRNLKSSEERIINLKSGTETIAFNNLFLKHEIEDSQLRMIFTACHPKLDSRDQISFALKTIAGFSDKEIAAALLLKTDTVKKRLSRARKTIKKESIMFSIPDKTEIETRLRKVHEVLYLIFNEGFHSTKSEILVRKELCGEAIRLITLILKKEELRTGEGYALFALFCFHAARLESKVIDGDVLDLKDQDRSMWYRPLVNMGNSAHQNSLTFSDWSEFHYESAIAAEHANATSFEETNWKKILELYKLIHENYPTDYSLMNLAIVYIQLEDSKNALECLNQIVSDKLANRKYLYFGVFAEYYLLIEDSAKAIDFYNKAINHVSNKAEKIYLTNKLNALKKNYKEDMF